MKTDRNMAEIAREMAVSEQNMQHFMSNSPWSGRMMIENVQQAVCARGELAGGMLILDESADEKSGDNSAGAARQHNGRLGKIEQSQVGVYLAYAKEQVWTLVDGELFVPEKWFNASYAAKRARVGLPTDQVFQTKIELGWTMIQRVQAQGLPFEAVAFDSLYGRSAWLRDQCHQAAIEYYADVPANYAVYLEAPELDWQTSKRGQTHCRVVEQKPVPVSDCGLSAETVWEKLTLRACERGMLTVDMTKQLVWTVNSQGQIRQEILLIRRQGSDIRYSLTNASPQTPLLTLAQRHSQRHRVECSLQDAKSELGMDEFQATHYRAWEHHLALTILASWFIAETRLDWATEHPRDLTLLDDYGTDTLPPLSMANVRDLLRATLPLRQLSPQQAASLVVQHLDNRTRSRRSRLRKHSGP
jgi:SRSO17 transposase